MFTMYKQLVGLVLKSLKPKRSGPKSEKKKKLAGLNQGKFILISGQARPWSNLARQA